jgi:large subunit ribosomal protein LP2
MKTVAAYLLCVLGGNATPSAEDVSKVLSSVGIASDDEQVAALIADLDGKVRKIN